MMRRLPAALLAVSFAAGFAHAALTTPDAPRVTVEQYEDGSGVERRDGRIVRTYDEGTFLWDCTTQGNRQCGAPGRS